MQTVFFQLSGVLPINKAIGLLKASIEKAYVNKGPEVRLRAYANKGPEVRLRAYANKGPEVRFEAIFRV